MEEEKRSSWTKQFLTTARRLIDERPSWLFRLEPLPSETDSVEWVAESFRRLCTNLRIHSSGQYRTLIVTSPAPQEGKSTAAANLAITLAGRGLSVLLVDADLRRPVQHEIFAIPNDKGLSNCLEGGARPDEVIQQAGGGVHILTSGSAVGDPGMLLGSGAMKDLIADLGGKYKVILFDTPPVLSVTDAAVLAPHVDWSIFVLRAGLSITEEAARARTMLEKAGGHVLGSILNGHDVQLEPSYHGYADYYSTPLANKT